MGNLRACFAVALLALAACGSDHGKADASITIQDSPMPDSKVFMDAPPPTYDFTCMGNSAPTTATANITLGGTVQRVYLNGTQPGIMPDQGASVKACKAGAANCMAQNHVGSTATTDANGGFSIGPNATTMMPLDVFLDMTHTGSRPTMVYPPSPFTADQSMIPVLTFDPALITLLGNFGCAQNDATNGIVILAITECANAHIDDTPNTTLTIKQGGSDVSGTSVLDLGQLSAMAAGTYLVCNVPADAATTVGATYSGKMLRSHDVKVVAGSSTATIVRPGY
jgi:hypothetical protein